MVVKSEKAQVILRICSRKFYRTYNGFATPPPRLTATGGDKIPWHASVSPRQDNPARLAKNHQSHLDPKRSRTLGKSGKGRYHRVPLRPVVQQADVKIFTVFQGVRPTQRNICADQRIRPVLKFQSTRQCPQPPTQQECRIVKNRSRHGSANEDECS